MTSRFDDLGFDAEFLGPEEEQKARVSERIFTVARKAMRQIPFMEDVLAAYYCALDPATPSRVRGAIFAALAYFVMPFDAVPDMLVGIGFGDDASILLGVLALVRAHVRDEHLAAARKALHPETDNASG